MIEDRFRRNVDLYPWYRVASDALAWMPVFFLYFSQHLSFQEVLWLEALYYVSVVSLEVPSGYFSDRIGRRPTLLVSTLAFILAYIFFLAGSGFAVFAVGQVCLAAGIAFRSGTDTAFHYDSLESLGRHAEYAGREARAERFGLISSAGAALVGGIAGTAALRLPYVISLVAAFATLLLVARFVEPARTIQSLKHGSGFTIQLKHCVRYLRDSVLAWVFALYVVLYVLAHVPYEFYQPYLKLLEHTALRNVADAPLASGVVLSLTMLAGAWVAGHSVRWRDRLGLTGVLLLAAGAQLGVVVGLAAILHPGIIALVLLRNVPMALSHAPINAAIAPRVDTAYRATYLSIQSLAGRLAFAVLLAALSMGIPPSAAIDWPALSSVLRISALVGIIALLALLATSRRLKTTKAKTSSLE